MAKAKTYLVIHRGYVGDHLWGDLCVGKEPKCPVPAGKMSCLKYVDWLAQKGFGPGYYNNSGRYAVAYKVKVSEDTDVFWSMGTEVCEDAEAHSTKWKELKAHAKRQNKIHPY